MESIAFSYFLKMGSKPPGPLHLDDFQTDFKHLCLMFSGMQHFFLGDNTCVQPQKSHFQNILLLTVQMSHFGPEESEESEFILGWISAELPRSWKSRGCVFAQNPVARAGIRGPSPACPWPGPGQGHQGLLKSRDPDSHGAHNLRNSLV